MSPVARNTDPGTSHAAAQSVTELTARQNAILEMVAATFKEGFTDEQMIAAYNYICSEQTLTPSGFPTSWEHPRQSDSGLRTRRKELVDCGRLENSGRFAKTSSGRSTIIWTLPDEG